MSRSYFGILDALPGVTNDIESVYLGSTRPTVNGSLWQESGVFVDGVDATHGTLGRKRLDLPAVDGAG